MAGGFRKLIQSPYYATGNPETEEMTTLYAPGMLGCIAPFDQGGISGPPNNCIYQLVVQDTAITGSLGGPMVWKTKGSYSVTNVFTNLGQVAGVCRKAVVTAASFIWIAKKGDLGVLLIGVPTSTPDATGKPIGLAGSPVSPAADCIALTTAIADGEYIGGSLGAAVANIAPCRINITDWF